MNPEKHGLDASDQQLEDLLQDALKPGSVPEGLTDRIIANTQASLGQDRSGIVGWVFRPSNLRIAAVIVLSCITAMWVMFAANRGGDKMTDLAAVQSEMGSLLAEEPLALEVDQAIAVLSLQIDQYQWDGDWQKQLVWVDDILSQTDEQFIGSGGPVSF